MALDLGTCICVRAALVDTLSSDEVYEQMDEDMANGTDGVFEGRSEKRSSDEGIRTGGQP